LQPRGSCFRRSVLYITGMSEAERRAMLGFLKAHAELRTIERRIQRRETLVVILASAVVALNVVVPAEAGFQPLDLIHYAIACGFALNLRRIVLDHIERRRDMWVLNRCAQYARQRLADEYVQRASRIA
jgi:hypothetical protein